MARFNTSATITMPDTVNLAGGQAYSESSELELTSLVLTSFLKDQYYRELNEIFKRVKELINECDKLFVAKLAVYARNEFGMRTISHVLASEIANDISKTNWAKYFYYSIIHRPDDMTEIIAYHFSNKRKLTNAMRKGFKLAFNKFDNYQLAKYKNSNKKIKLIDVVNLVHPKPIERNCDAIKALVNNNLKAFGTWEVELSEAGQGDDIEIITENKKQVWINLIKSKKIGYFALLRNLRNIINQAPEIIPEALEILTNRELIKNSLVFPFRYLLCFKEIIKIKNPSIVRDVLTALNKAVDISLDNVPKFDGSTLVALDVSDSMTCKIRESGATPAEIGSLFASVLIKNNNADLVCFDDTANYFNVNINDSTLTITSLIKEKFMGGGTNFHEIFRILNKAYDRIIILSDMQGWEEYYCPTKEFKLYKEQYNCNPYLYSFDLAGYGTLQFPEDNVFCLAGFSDRVFDVMKILESDKNALINTIKNYKFI